MEELENLIRTIKYEIRTKDIIISMFGGIIEDFIYLYEAEENKEIKDRYYKTILQKIEDVKRLVEISREV